MKLWVDDIRTPPDLPAQAGDSWHICRTVHAAAMALYNFSNEITEISLDHDISHQIELGGVSRPFPCAETFVPVAILIGLTKQQAIWNIEGIKWDPIVTIHTSNPSGGKLMKDILDEYGIEATLKPMGAANRLETFL